MRELILGGARSGKSRLAEQQALASGLAVTYIATSQALDGEMTARIAHHQARRPAEWALREEPLELARVLRDNAAPDRCLLVDCLTLWLTHWLMPADTQEFEAKRPAAPDWQAQLAMFLRVIEQPPGPVVLVGNEIGLGVIPLGREVRAFVDALGQLNQQVAAACQRVTLMAAGLPLALKGDRT